MWKETELSQLSQMGPAQINQQPAYSQTIKELSHGQKELSVDSLNQEAEKCLLF